MHRDFALPCNFVKGQVKMMQKLLKQLNKQFDTQLIKNSTYQKFLDTMHSFLKEQQMDWKNEHEFSCFQNEVLYYSLLNKKQFEDTFRSVYVSMFDYWRDLDYQERKHQVNVDIDRLKPTLRSFRFHDQDIYLPIFDERMNRVYRDEMVLFDLKQYGRFKTDFKDILVTEDYYGDILYQSDFCSCCYIATCEKGTVLYHPLVNRLYIVSKGTCVDTISLDPACVDQVDDGKLQILISCYVSDDVISMMEFMIEQKLVKDKFAKKLMKQLSKMKKKQK